MTALVTAVTEFSNTGNTRVYTLPSHSVTASKKLTQTRKVPVGNQTSIEDKLYVQYSTNDADGVEIPQKISFTVQVVRPIGHTAADVTSALAVFRDVVQSDEFTNVVNTQEYLK